MPDTMTVAVVRRVITPAEYEAMVAPPPQIPTQAEILESQIALWTGVGLATENDLRQLAQFVPDRGIFLFMPELVKPYDLARFMGLVVLNGKTGVNYLDAQYLKDDVKVPSCPYIMLDLEDGRARLNTKPSVSQTDIVKDHRSPYICVETIAHAAAFPGVLKHHFMDACGSRYRKQRVPSVDVRGDEPALVNRWEDDAYPRWGAASCGSRKGLRG